MSNWPSLRASTQCRCWICLRFPAPTTELNHKKKRHKKPWSETDMPISEAVRPPRGSPALPTVNGSPKEVRSFSESQDFALRVRQAGGVFYHIWCVKVCASQVEGLTEYHIWASSPTQIPNPGKKSLKKKKKKCPKCWCLCESNPVLLVNFDTCSSMPAPTISLRFYINPEVGSPSGGQGVAPPWRYTSWDCTKNWIYYKSKYSFSPIIIISLKKKLDFKNSGA